MKNYIFLLVSAIILAGCNANNNQPQPENQPEAQEKVVEVEEKKKL